MSYDNTERQFWRSWPWCRQTQARDRGECKVTAAQTSADACLVSVVGLHLLVCPLLCGQNEG